MNPKNQGLTVGELTMTIGALIIVGLLWSTVVNKGAKERSSADFFNTIVSNELINQIS